LILNARQIATSFTFRFAPELFVTSTATLRLPGYSDLRS
jgi:hypothetical protein